MCVNTHYFVTLGGFSCSAERLLPSLGGGGGVSVTGGESGLSSALQAARPRQQLSVSSAPQFFSPGSQRLLVSRSSPEVQLRYGRSLV